MYTQVLGKESLTRGRGDPSLCSVSRYVSDPESLGCTHPRILKSLPRVPLSGSRRIPLCQIGPPPIGFRFLSRKFFFVSCIQNHLFCNKNYPYTVYNVVNPFLSTIFSPFPCISLLIKVCVLLLPPLLFLRSTPDYQHKPKYSIVPDPFPPNRPSSRLHKSKVFINSLCYFLRVPPPCQSCDVLSRHLLYTYQY